MKVVVKVEGIFDSGVGHSFVKHTLEVPEFEDEHFNLIDDFEKKGIVHNLNKSLPKHIYDQVHTKESKVCDWIDENINFLNIFPDMYTCINYDILKIKSKNKEIKIKKEISTLEKTINSKLEIDNSKLKLSLSYFLSQIKDEKLQQQLCDDVQAVYVEIKDCLKGVSVEKQVNIIFNAISVGYKASTNTLNQLSEYSKNVKERLKESSVVDVMFLEQHLREAKNSEEKKDIKNKFLNNQQNID